MYTEEQIQEQTKKSKKTKKKKKSNSMDYLVLGFFVVVIIILLILIFKPTKEEPENELVFKLIGGEVSLKIDEIYDEPGFYCYDRTNNYVRSVEVTNNIVYKKPGEYTVTYKYQDKILTRKVIIQEPSSYDLNIDYTVDNTSYTNEDITVNYSIYGDSFLEVTLPDGSRRTDLTGKFIVTANGDYEIKAYNIREEEFVKEVNITNIDKELPTGSCDALVKNKSSEIKVNANDNTKIVKYEYYDNTKLLNSSETTSYVTTTATSSTISVRVYDIANNVSELKCNVTEKKYYDPITPSSTDKIVYQANTETLKVYIIKRNSYYLTRIWAMDPYSQLNKAPSPEYGKKMYYPKTLLNKAVASRNLQNKEVIGFNASGFYLSGTYDAPSVRAYPAYDKTAVGTIVINNGVVVRNAYNKAVKQWYLLGINKDNQMVIFEDNVASTTTEINNKKVWSQTVINSGIRNTFSFAGPVIQNGRKLTTFSESMPDPKNTNPKKLQLICQINDNNFALFTSANENRKVAIDLFASMGCKTAFNFDGGGSIALMYKPKNSTQFTTVIGGARELPEAGYFTE